MYITKTKLLKWALYSNVIYIVLLFLLMPNGINFQKILTTSFLFFSEASIIYLSLKNWHLLKNLTVFARRLFYMLIIWGCIIIVKSFSLNIQDWVTNFGHVNMAIVWVMPLLILLGQKIEYWSIVFKTIIFMLQTMTAVFFLIPFFKISGEWTWLLRPVNFLLIMGIRKYNFTYRAWFYFLILMSLVIANLVSRRMEFLYLGIVIVFLIIDKISSISLKKTFLKYIIAGFTLVLVLVFTVGYEFVSNLVLLVIEFQDSRTFLFTELFADMSVSEQFFGRGSLGTYYSDFFEKTRRYYELSGKTAWAGDVPDRITTEVGYLQMILKGGFVMLFLNVTIMVYSSYLAIFKSNNIFIKRLGYYILVITILSMVEFRPAFTPTFIILWIAIGTVLNKKYRQMENDQIEALIKFK